jgi:hypothetical protein
MRTGILMETELAKLKKCWILDHDQVGTFSNCHKSNCKLMSRLKSWGLHESVTLYIFNATMIHLAEACGAL